MLFNWLCYNSMNVNPTRYKHEVPARVIRKEKPLNSCHLEATDLYGKIKLNCICWLWRIKDWIYVPQASVRWPGCIFGDYIRKWEDIKLDLKAILLKICTEFTWPRIAFGFRHLCLENIQAYVNDNTLMTLILRLLNWTCGLGWCDPGSRPAAGVCVRKIQ